MTEKFKFHFQRFEFKYMLPVRIVDYLIPEILKFMESDPYARGAQGTGYRVKSLYFDSAGLDCYWQKKAGVRSRKKLRLRWYDSRLTPRTTVFLEIKKKYDAVVIKDRVAAPYGEVIPILFKNHDALLAVKGNEMVWREFTWLLRYNAMVPQVEVHYDRMPYISRADAGFRLTLDTNITCARSSIHGESGQAWAVTDDYAIVEVKFNNTLPFWFLHVIEKFSLEQSPYSKYCSSIEASRIGFDRSALHENYQNVFTLL